MTTLLHDLIYDQYYDPGQRAKAVQQTAGEKDIRVSERRQSNKESAVLLKQC